MPYIYSTLTAGQDYTTYIDNSANGVVEQLPDKVIRIKGGANLITKQTDEYGNLITPTHAVTEITDEELALLKTNQVFNLHVKNGYIQIVEGKKLKENFELDLNPADKAAPLNRQDQIKAEKKLREKVPDLITKNDH